MADEVLVMEARLRNHISGELNKIGQGLQKVGKEGEETFGQKMKNSVSNAGAEMGRFLARFGPGAIAVGVLAKGMRELGQSIEFVKTVSMDFEKTLSTVKAILEPTSNEFAVLTLRAKELGESTVHSATQAGQAFVEMGKLGMSANEIIAASEGVLNLATVSQVDMAAAAKTSVAVLNQFGLEAKESSRVVDVMARSFNMSALDINKFTESMKMAGPVAGNTGVEIETTTAALGVLADRGIDASLAGTAMRRIFLELADSTSKASQEVRRINPDATTFVEKLEALRAGGLDATKAVELFTIRGSTAAQVIVENVDKLKEYESTLNSASGTGKRFADTMLDNVAGATVLLESAQQSLGIAIGEAFSDERRKNLNLYTSMILRAKDYVVSHREELSALGAVIGDVFRMIVVLGGAIVRWVGVAFSAISTVANQAVFLVSSGIKGILDLINWASNKIGKGDIFDVSVIASVVEQSAEGVGKSVHNMIAAFTGESYAASEATIKLAEDIKKARETAMVDPEDPEAPAGAEEQIKKDWEWYRWYTGEVKRLTKEATDAHKAEIAERVALVDAEIAGIEAQMGALRVLEDARVEAIPDYAERRMAELLLAQERERAAYEGHYEALLILEEAHEQQRLTLQRETDAQRAQAMEDANMMAINATIRAADSLIRAMRNSKEELKPIYVALATMRAGTAIATGVKVAWDGAEDIGGVPGVVYGIAMSAVTVAENLALLGGQLSAIRSAAKGMDETVTGGQLFRFGDNPARREHVVVTPDDGPGTEGGQMTRDKQEGFVFAPVLNFNAPVTEDVADYTVEQLEGVARQYRRAQFEGLL